MTQFVAASAAVAWLLAWAVLGTDWEGRLDSTGRMVDAVSLGQWAVFWVLLALLGVAVGSRLRGTLPRTAALLPVLAYLAVQLWSPLGPIPIVIYLVPTLGIWFVSLIIGGRWAFGLANQPPPRGRALEHPSPSSSAGKRNTE